MDYEQDLPADAEALGISGEGKAEALQSLASIMQHSAARNARAKAAVERLAKDLPSGCVTRMIPWLDHDIRDLGGLHELAPYLD